MSIKIRLAKTGKKNAPTYKVVVSNTRDKRNGKALDVLGHFNPGVKPHEFVLDKAKLSEWKTKGATLTDAVENLIAGKYEYVKYEPKKKTS